MSIYIGVGKKSMQGPCPDGFHVPSKNERDTAISTFGTRNTPSAYAGPLKLPRNGQLNYSSGNISYTDSYIYRTSTYDTNGKAYGTWHAYDAQYDFTSTSTYIGYGASIRPFKDEYVPNTGDGWTKINNSAYRNESLGLITLPTRQLTLADKNLGAINVGDNGNYYQWGNNYGFVSGQVTTSSTAVSAAGYGPGNYYNSSTFITQAIWDSSYNPNLRGGSTSGGAPEILNVYLGTTPAREVYVGTTLVRPVIKDATIEWLLVGGGGAGGRARCRAGGGGGAGGLIYCASETLPIGTCRCVVIGAGGTGAASAYNPANYKGGNSCFGSVVAYGGGGGGGMCSYSRGCAGAAGGSGGGGAACNAAGGTVCNASYGNCGGAGYNTTGGGGGGAGGAGCPANGAGNYYGGAGGAGCTSSISGASVVYAAGGGGGGCTGISNSQGGGCGGCYRVAGCAATTYGSGGGGGGCTASNSCCMAGGNGCQGVFIARYPSNCKFNVTGGTKYLCNGYCIHCFTSNGTLCVS